MAYINVAEWTPDQVTDWLKGLDDTMYNYVYSFTNNEVGGQQLLNIRPYELEQLGMHSIGHQEIVLEAVENLRNFHYNLDKENLQFMALHVATAARNLHRQLANHSDSSKIETQILNDITRTIATIHPIIGWLDRSPFHGRLQFNEIRGNMLRLGLEMATSAQRDRFVQNPVDQIKATAEKLERLANYIIQDISDPMLLQPASLNLVTLKKRESELGFSIVPSYHGIHRVTDIKYNSPAHNSGKIEDGDEIVQINYQTVVGWQYKTVLLQLSESLPDVLLTLKKRPKHMKIYGQIYMQPYRLPSKKRNMAARWGENLPSPRAGFLPVPDFNLPLKMKENATASASSVGASGVSSDTDSSCSDILTPTDNKSAEKEIRLYYPKPRAMLQRRNTICGDELFGRERHVSGLPLWHEHKIGGNHCEPASPSLRDKSVSFGFGLELTPRPTTCIGIASGTGKFGTGDLKGSFSEIKPKEVIKIVTETPSEKISPDDNEKSKPGVSKVVRFGANMKCSDYPRLDEKYTCNVEDTILETFEPIPFADDEEAETLEALRNATNKADNILETLEKVTQNAALQPSLVEAINPHAAAAAAAAVRRGRLDKSHSTPAYDNSEEGESDTPPPAIEPRKEFLIITPPVPPPRPKKQSELAPPEVPPPPPKPASLRSASTGGGEQTAKTIILTVPTITQEIEKAPELPATVTHSTLLPPGEKNELHTPTKTKTLTLKKKNSLISKRRKMNLKLLGTGDIQGHLYRRTKDRRGVTFWARLYFVLLDTNLYGFRTKEALKANCLIFLPGFTVSLAKEVHSKPYAFKVYHPSKTFYFATESQEALTQWIDFIRQATLQTQLASGKSSAYLEPSSDINIKELYSETDSSGEENETTIIKNLSTPSPQGGGSRDGMTSLTATKSFSTPTSTNSTKQDKRYLGSLRKFTKSSFISKGSSSQNERKPSSDIPVPTEQYRSYRKVPGGSFGIQIGTNTPGYHDSTMHPFNNNSSNLSTQSGSPNSFSTSLTTVTTNNNTLEQPPMPQRKLSISSSRSSIVSVSGDSIALSLGPPSTPAPTPNVAPIASQPTSPPAFYSRHKPSVASSSSSFDSPSKASMKKTFPCNFIHASNPNLVEFDFQTSKTLDYSLPKINPANPWDAQQTMQGFVTLKDLMLQKQEEEAQEMYNNRVLLGVEKKHESRSSSSRNTNEKSEEQQQQQQLAVDNNSQQQQQEKWTQKRSLPKTPDYEISFKPDDEDIKRTRTKEGLKLRDFGYELISGDEPISGKTAIGTTATRQHSNELQAHEHSWTAAMRTRHLLKTQQLLMSGHSKGNKKHSSNSCSSTTSSDFAGISGASLSGEKRAGSFKKKGKLEAFKTSKERIFQFSKHSGSSAQQSAMTMTLPLNKKSSESMNDQSAAGSGIKKSHTYNSELKDKASGKYEAQRKNSAPMPILGKLSLSSASSAAPSVPPTKEKKLLGSPLLHRTLFGHHSNSSTHSSAHGGGGGLSPLTTPTACCTGREYDQEIFSQVLFNKVPSYHSESAAKFRHLSSSNCNIVAPDMLAPPPPIAAAQQQTASDAPPLPPHADICRTMSHVTTTPAATPEYPNLECPPVFEPEIYSLTDPNANLTFLRRRNNNSSNLGADAEESQ